jgi:hypothetical protein
VAVKVTEDPAQIVPDGLAAMDMVAGVPAVIEIATAPEVFEHPPEVTVLLYHVAWVSDPGV